MRTWKRNWILKRMVLGFAVAALVAPAAAQARVDEGINGQPNSAKELVVKSGAPSGMTRAQLNAYFSVSTHDGVPSGMPSAGLNDYLMARDGIEVVRLQPRSTLRSSDLIEKVRVAPKGGTAQVVSSPGFNWGDAGIGALLALGLIGFGVAAYRATRHVGSPQTA
jgi:hypothetical protein